MILKILSILWPKKSAPSAFFSYSRKHSGVVMDFYNFGSIFKGKHFIDERSIPYGSSFPAEIADAIDKCDVFVLMWCACAHDSRWVQAELGRAIERQKHIVPVLLSDYPLPPEIETINGVRLHAPVCRQTSFGMDFGEHLFEDQYVSMLEPEKMRIHASIESSLKKAFQPGGRESLL
jgi:hypothetical protein